MSQPKRFTVCPNCKVKLYKEDIALFYDFDALSGKLLKKAAICRYCGYTLKEVKYEQQTQA